MRKLNRFQIGALLNFGKGAIEEIISEEAKKGNHSHEFSSVVLGSNYIIYFDDNGEILAAFDKEEDNCEDTAEDYINYLEDHDTVYNYILDKKEKENINQFIRNCDNGLRGDYLNCWSALETFYNFKMATYFYDKSKKVDKKEDKELYSALSDEYSHKKCMLRKGGDK